VVLELHKMYRLRQLPALAVQPRPQNLVRRQMVQMQVSGPAGCRSYKALKFLPVLEPGTFSRLDLRYDLVISSSGAEAKFIKSNFNTVHVACYHAPTHYYWARYEEYLKLPVLAGWIPWPVLALSCWLNLRWWDKRAQRLKTISSPIQEVLPATKSKKKYYDRGNDEVIHPPVDVERFSGHVKPASERHGFVTAGRQTPISELIWLLKLTNKIDEALASYR